MLDVLVDGKHYVKVGFGLTKKLPVRQSLPPHLFSRTDLMFGQKTFEPPIDIMVKKDFYECAKPS